jgi:hypothetical protein
MSVTMRILGRSLAFALTATLVSIGLDLLLWRLTAGNPAHRFATDLSLHELVHLVVFIASAAGALLSFSTMDAELPPVGSVLMRGLLASAAGLPVAAWLNDRYGPLAGGTLFFAAALIAAGWGRRDVPR